MKTRMDDGFLGGEGVDMENTIVKFFANSSLKNANLIPFLDRRGVP